jgi:sortase (surface protein transpeptidase)
MAAPVAKIPVAPTPLAAPKPIASPTVAPKILAPTPTIAPKTVPQPVKPAAPLVRVVAPLAEPAIITPVETPIATAVKPPQPPKKSHFNWPKRLPSLKKIFKKPTFFTVARYAVAGVILVVAGYLAVDAWRVNRQNEVNAAIILESETDTDFSMSSPQIDDDDEESPAEDAPTPETPTPPTLPKKIKIPKLGIDARVVSAGLNRSGRIATPTDGYRTAWYNASSKPGTNGAMFINGHVGVATTGKAVFFYLKNLVAGDKISVERGDGMVFNYVVKKVVTVPADQVNMNEALSVYDDGQDAKQGLNLMTCGGTFDRNSKEYDSRVIVFSVLE